MNSNVEVVVGISAERNAMAVPQMTGSFQRTNTPFCLLVCLAKLWSSAAALTPTKTCRSMVGLPNDTWDGHMHIIDPIRYPLATDAVYIPGIHSTWDAVTFESSVDMENIIIVQPSIYGNDNSALLDALTALGPNRSRGVVVFDDTTTDDSTLRQWHDLGVRGVRLNLASVDGETDIEAFKITVSTYAALVQPLGWMVQIYTSMGMLPGLESIIRDTPNVKFCFDHFARPSKPNTNSTAAFDPYTIAGFSSLVTLLKEGNTWVKFSAPYRVELEERQLDVLAREILRVRSDRVVFATDWPHTRFEGLDIRPFQERVLDWAQDTNCVDRVFSTNAKELWSIER